MGTVTVQSGTDRKERKEGWSAKTIFRVKTGDKVLLEGLGEEDRLVKQLLPPWMMNGWFGLVLEITARSKANKRVSVIRGKNTRCFDGGDDLTKRTSRLLHSSR